MRAGPRAVGRPAPPLRDAVVGDGAVLRDVEAREALGDRGGHAAADAHALDREDTAEGVRVRGRVPATVAERFARFDVSENGAAADNGI